MAKEKRKPGQRSRNGETKGEIIKYALEHGGMFEGSVLKDFLEENCNVRRETTKKHLDDLNKKGIFEKTGEKGYTNNWRIIEDTKAIAIIYKEYPHLLRYLQQSDFISDCIAKKKNLLFEDNDAFVELKKMLRLSPKMFELCLTVDNLGRKFLLVSSKIDYYGISEIAFEKTFSKGGENSDNNGAIKHYIRWQLFRSCLKTDVSFIVTGSIPEEIDDLLSKESINRLKADATLNGEFEFLRSYIKNKRMDAYRKAISEELFEAFRNPGKFDEKIKELFGNNPEKFPESIKEVYGKKFRVEGLEEKEGS
jgi:hypothetical protein